MTKEEIIKIIKNHYFEISPGVYLYSKSSIKEAAVFEDWYKEDEDDQAKSEVAKFNSYEFWYTTNDGVIEGFKTLEEIFEVFEDFSLSDSMEK